MSMHKAGDSKVPDPLAPGHIEGQNPATPERLPGHTGAVSGGAEASNEEELGGRPAFLFEAGDARAATLDSSGANLPAAPDGTEWRLARYFTLGVRDAGLIDIRPESIILGILRSGYHVWRTGAPRGAD